MCHKNIKCHNHQLIVKGTPAVDCDIKNALVLFMLSFFLATHVLLLLFSSLYIAGIP